MFSRSSSHRGRLLPIRAGFLTGVLFSIATVAAVAAPVSFEIPAQPAPLALGAFSRQSGAQVTFNQDELKSVTTNAVVGSFEPKDALVQLLKGTGYRATQRSSAWFVVTLAPSAAATSSVRGHLVATDGQRVENLSARLSESGQTALVSGDGDFVFSEVRPGTYTIVVTAPGYQPLHITQVVVRSGSDVVLGRQRLRRISATDEVTKMAPYVVEADIVAEMDPFEVTAGRTQPFSTPNVDLPRTVNDAQAYYMFDARDIDRAGVVNLEQFIKRNLPMQTAANSADQGFFVGGNRGYVNLRGLGSNQTLVLLNGRRASGGNLALNGGADGLNVNIVPLGAIDRVEVLPASASAIYGAGAVGGVINIVLKRNFSGGEMKATWQNPDDTDAPIRKLDLNYGFSLEGGRTQVMLAGGFSDQKLLQARDRAELMSGYAWRIRQNLIAATGNPAQAWLGATPTIINSPSTINLTLKPAYGGGSIGSPITFIPYGITAGTPTATLGAALRANAGQVNSDLPDTRQLVNGLRSDIGTASKLTTFMATIRREMTPWLEFNGEFWFTGDKNNRNMVTPPPLSVSAAAPSNPFTTTVSVTLPYAGEFPVFSDNVSRRATAGLLLKLPFDWTAQADYTRTDSSNSFSATGTLFSFNDIIADLNSGNLNPFVDSTLAAPDLSRYSSTQTWTGKGTLNDVALRLAGPVGRLPAGAPSLALGLQRRQDGFSDGVSSFTYVHFPNRSIQSLALGKKSVVRSAYVETRIPVIGRENRLLLARELDLQLAWRLEDFAVGTGTTSIPLLPVPTTPPTIRANEAVYKSSNPTAGLTWRPIGDLMFRTSYSKGFVPPTYPQLAAPVQATNPTTVGDPQRGGIRTSVFTASGGNPDLRPELSDTISAGVVFEPEAGLLKGLRLGVDYVYIEKEDNISTLSAQLMVDNEANFPGRVTRGAVPPGDPFGVGPITLVNTSPVNLLRAFDENVDVSLRWRKSTTNLGNFDFNALATFGLGFVRKTAINTAAIDTLGYNNFPLEFTGNATLVWDFHRFSAGWTTRYIPRLHVLGPPVSTSLTFRQGQGADWVPSQTYHDVFLSYRFPLVVHAADSGWSRLRPSRLLNGLEVQLAVYNVFRHKPPLDNSTQGSYVYSTYGDIRLRDIRISIKKPL